MRVLLCLVLSSSLWCSALPALALPCDLLGGDADGDGICEDGSGSGIVGDLPCSCQSGSPPACTSGCDDNCPWTANPTQLDVGRVGSPDTPDGFGDDCQCLDTSDDGRANLLDVTRERRVLQSLLPPRAAPEKCLGVGPNACDAGDVTLLREVLAALAAAPANVCMAAGSCSSSADCPSGVACDTSAQRCAKNSGQACVQGSQCLGGSCCSNACRNVTNDVANCGGCGVACQVPNATPVCTAGTCGVGTCNPGFFDCDLVGANGCEVVEGGYSNSPPGEDLGTYPADANGGASCTLNACSLVATRSGSSGRFFSVVAQEASTCPAYVGMRIDLQPGVDADFDLYVSIPASCFCWPDVCASTEGVGTLDSIQVWCEDDTGDDTFTTQIDVQYYSGGDACQPWTLSVYAGAC
jgi:hypothetical protein